MQDHSFRDDVPVLRADPVAFSLMGFPRGFRSLGIRITYVLESCLADIGSSLAARISAVDVSDPVHLANGNVV